MPFINLKTNISVSSDQENKLKSKFGKAISIIPGKSEMWLMVNIEDNAKLYFRGDGSNPAAFVEVKLFGGAGGSDYNRLTGEITDILTEVLSIAPNSIYIRYEETEYWGYNGHNF